MLKKCEFSLLIIMTKEIQIVLKTQKLLHLRKLTKQKAQKIQKKKEFIGKKV